MFLIDLSKSKRFADTSQFIGRRGHGRRPVPHQGNLGPLHTALDMLLCLFVLFMCDSGLATSLVGWVRLSLQRRTHASLGQPDE